MDAPYYPYRSGKIGAIFMAVIMWLSFVCLFFTHHDSFTLGSLPFAFGIFVILSIWALKAGFAASKIYITCNSDCLCIYEKNIQHSFSWNDLTYKYRACSFPKGRKYLVLSKYELQKKEINKIINKNFSSTKVRFDDYCVIYLDEAQRQTIQNLERCIDTYMNQNVKED